MALSRRLIIMGAGAVIALAGSAVVGYRLANPEAPALPPIDIGGPIDLVDQDGRRFTNADIGGKPFAVFFGFTHCPNVCPTTLSDLTLGLEQLGPLSDKIRVLFVTVDPERDTPQAMKDYLSAFDPRITGLSGSPEAIARVAKAYKVFYEKAPTEGGDYTMNHTASVLLMDGKGEFVGTLAFEEERTSQVAKLKRLAENG